MKFLTNLDLSQNEIQNAVIQPLAAAPANPKLGQIYYNSSDSLLYQYDGAQWKPVGKGYELPAAIPRPPSAASRWAAASAWLRTAHSRPTSRPTTT